MMNSKKYYSANDFYREFFGEKVYKISLNGGMSCPNRDGRISHGGCIFCSEGGSGDFAANALFSVTEQINQSIEKVRKKYKGNRFIAYFQAFTNTYAPVEYLEKIFTEAISNPVIAGLSIATRPDCLEDDKIALISELNRVKPVFVELGLQTSNENTAVFINRGYTNSVFTDAVSRLQAQNIKVIAHVIIGLPGEAFSDYENTVRYLSDLNIHGIKLQLLHVLKNTKLFELYEKGLVKTLDCDEYIDIIVRLIELLPPEMVVYRITGDGPRRLLAAPLWSTDKKNTINKINRVFEERNTYQGRNYHQWQSNQ